MIQKSTSSTAGLVLFSFGLAYLLGGTVSSVQAEKKPAREAWFGLVGSEQPPDSPFAYVQRDPHLPNVLIYGDSISIQYTPALRQALAGRANVFRLHCNGGDSSTLVEKMEKLHTTLRDPNLDEPWDFEWDVIHFNVGLHDLKYLNENKKLDRENGKQVHSLQQYEDHLKRIVAYLKQLAPKAELLFATTTPVPEGAEGRAVEDAVEYNRVALSVMKEHPEIYIDDLYAFTLPHQSQWWSQPGNVHFNEEGRKAQGEEVARIILERLKKE